MVASGIERRHRSEVPLPLVKSATGRGRPRTRLLTLAAAALLGGCLDFRLEGPENPDPVPVPRLVNVTIEYRQPPECVAGSPRCDDNVVFFGNWMRPGEEFLLRPDPGRYIWRGTALRVPVNFPPRTGNDPYFVRVYDPHMVASPTGGYSAERLRIGDEVISRYDSPGSNREAGLIYIDENGFGRSPS
jgi:hypothetical protein